MEAKLQDYSYGKKWTQFKMDHYSGYDVRMSDYHRHSYYEISLIYSGNVNVLLDGYAESGEEPRMVLLRPGAAHYIASDPKTLYSRRNILFSPEFASNNMPQSENILCVFAERGNVIKLNSEMCERFLSVFSLMEKETDTARICCLLCYMLMLVGELVIDKSSTANVPAYISEALSYVGNNFAQSLTAEELAWKLGIGRTTLMTHFKRYTGMTLKECITRCRLKSAIQCLENGMTVQQTAISCGFCDAGNLIYAFHRYYHTTPHQYVSSRLRNNSSEA